MAILPITEDNVETFSLETNPRRLYKTYPIRDSSGAKVYFTGSKGLLEETMGPTGSVYLFANNSPVEKETFVLGGSDRIGFQDDSLEELRRNITLTTSSNKFAMLAGYMSGVLHTSASFRKRKKLEIIRFTPSFNFTSNTIRKNLVVDHLMKNYRHIYPSMQFAYNNFNSLNFFSNPSSGINDSTTIPSSSAILYPNPLSNSILITSGVYESPYGFRPSSSFSFDFWIKPNYVENQGIGYRAGTIIHLSSSYSLSILSGSSKDSNGRPDKFKLRLMLGNGTDLPPDKVVANAPIGIFDSNDNILEINKWQHVTVRYGGKYYNNHTGSFVIDKIEQGTFCIENPGFGCYSGSISPSVLVVGNFFQGYGSTDNFFNSKTALRDGLIELINDVDEPSNYSLLNPLNAEIHDLKIYSKYLNSDEIESLQTESPSTLDNIKFYLPPYFTTESPQRQFVDTHGGILATPFQEKDGTTNVPFSYEMSLGVGGLYPNLENYVKDFSTGNFPRLWLLTGSAISPPSNVVVSANDFLYASGTNSGNNRKRLYTILPCDHGNWNPNYNILTNLTGTISSGRHVNDFGNFIPGLINLRNVTTASIFSSAVTTSGSAILNDILGAQPENNYLKENIGGSLTLLHRLRDYSSHHVVFFDISNLFYGNQIKPGSITLTDRSLSGSNGRFGMKIKDDGYGNLYRADVSGSYATWNSVGNVFYNEGILILKHPNLFFFGNEGFEIDFRGVQNIHTTTINAYAKSMQLISSSNPSYRPIPYDEELYNEPDQEFVYITNINVHDENLNVVAKAALAQPLAKKTGSKYLIKLRIDY
jgi:hypothetical protein